MAYELLWEGSNGILKRYFGFVSLHEFIESTENLHHDVRFKLIQYTINDFTSITGFDVSEEAVEDLAVMSQQALRINANIRLALVSSDARILALAEKFLSPSLKSYPLRVFENLEQAREWACVDSRFRPYLI